MRTRRKRELNALDMTPLVDMVFLLIIFFMLSTTFIVTPGVRIDLPRASPDKLVSEKKEVVLTIDRQGAIHFNRDPVDGTVLQTRLTALSRENKDLPVIIRGDRNAGFGRIVEVLEVVRKAGLHRIAIVTHRKEDAAADSKDVP